MKLLCKCLGGSHSYGLNTPSSDIDFRGVFANTSYENILCINEQDHIKEETGDVLYYELRRYIELLSKGNTTALEILFNNNWIDIDDTFKKCICDNAIQFIDSKRLYSCLRGYALQELELAMGNRPGVIGHKRAEAVKIYGFSPKNFCQLFRLLIVGRYFFETDKFIVNCKEFPDSREYDFIHSIKVTPSKWTASRLRSLFTDYDKMLDIAFNNRSKDHQFNRGYANEVILKIYGPMLAEEFTRKLNT